MIPQHTEQRIKDAAQIYDVVVQFVTLKKKGPRYVGLCPFHEERTPSFYVTPSKGICKCFGCGKGGDVFAFLKEYKRLDYPDALRYLAAMYNIETGEATGRPAGYSAPPPIAPRPPAPPPAPPSLIPKSDFRRSLKAYDANNFTAFLKNRFGTQTAADLIGRYFIGTATNRCVMFWYIDSRGNVRTGKRMQYDPATGKRTELENGNDAEYIHKRKRFGDGFNYVGCWYGEHLLPKRPGAPVAIVESEKTAILASLYLPDYVWLAVGGISGLPSNPERWEALTGRRIVLFPDCDPPAKDGKTPFQRWSQSAEAIRKMGYNIAVSDLLERTATDAIRAQKYDLADYLLKYDPADFQRAQEARTPAPQPAQAANAATAEPITTAQPTADTGQMEAPAALSAQEAADLMTGYGYEANIPDAAPDDSPAPDAWPDVPDLMNFFADHTPTAPVRLDAANLIKDPAAFITSHLMTVQTHNGRRAYLPYLERLRTLKRLMEAA